MYICPMKNRNTMRILSLFAIMAVALFTMSAGHPDSAATTWEADAAHSNVQFTVDHLVISEVSGDFKLFNGKMVSSKEDFSDAQIEFTVDVSSIDTDNEMRDNHLKGDDFFNAGKYPKMSFKSTSFKPKGGNKYELKGNLTIRDITKPVTFEVVHGGTVKDPYGNIKAGFKATTTIDRFDYNLKWNSVTEAGGAVVGPDVDIKLNIQLKKS